MYMSLLAPLALQNLKDKCLVKVTMDGILNNHDQLQHKCTLKLQVVKMFTTTKFAYFYWPIECISKI